MMSCCAFSCDSLKERTAKHMESKGISSASVLVNVQTFRPLEEVNLTFFTVSFAG